LEEGTFSRRTGVDRSAAGWSRRRPETAGGLALQQGKGGCVLGGGWAWERDGGHAVLPLCPRRRIGRHRDIRLRGTPAAVARWCARPRVASVGRPARGREADGRLPARRGRHLP